MSESEHLGTNILLPSARVAIFSNDNDTISAAQSLQDDWRYARVEVMTVQGDVESAIAHYAQGDTSPDLLIIQTENIDDGFTDRLGALSEHCSEGTAAIIIGPVNDVYLYRKLIDMGISDYLVKPIQADIFSEVIAKSLIGRLGVSDSRLIAFTGVKGGVGTSVLAQISAVLAAEKMGQKVVMLDAAGGCSSTSVGLGFDPTATLFEAYRAVNAGNEDSLKRMLHHVSEKLTVLATGADAMLDRSLSAEQFEEILDYLMVQYPVVIVDLSGAEASVRKAVISRASQNVIVSEPTVTSLRFCRSFLGEVSDVRGGDKSSVSLVLNKVGVSKAYEVASTDIKEVLDFEPSASIEALPSLFLKYESELPRLLVDKECEVIVSPLLKILSKSISGGQGGNSSESEKNSGLLGGFLNKLSAK